MELWDFRCGSLHGQRFSSTTLSHSAPSPNYTAWNQVRLICLLSCCGVLGPVLDSTSVKVHPDGTGALKQTAHKPSASPAADGTSGFIWWPRCSNSRSLRLSPGHDHDAPHGRPYWKLGLLPEGLPMLMDRAYEGNETRQTVLDLGMIPVVPPIYKKRTRSNDCSAGSRVSAVSSLASENSTFFS